VVSWWNSCRSGTIGLEGAFITLRYYVLLLLSTPSTCISISTYTFILTLSLTHTRGLHTHSLQCVTGGNDAHTYPDDVSSFPLWKKFRSLVTSDLRERERERERERDFGNFQVFLYIYIYISESVSESVRL
jgi:hypothetical protein